jgi:hypothetical protein
MTFNKKQKEKMFFEQTKMMNIEDHEGPGQTAKRA